jgi:hypothetical protein
LALISARPVPTLAARLWRLRYAVLYVACLAGFAHGLARFRAPHTGYSSLILFGEHFALRRLPQLGDVPLYTDAHQDGYDGQFYAQMAVAGNPFDRALVRALDSPPYDAPAWIEPGPDGRPLAFAVYGFYTAATPAL